jgi:hypothetical protein
VSGPIIAPGSVYELVVSPQAPTLIDLTMPGPQGPPGPPGPAGGATYVYDRAGVPAATWTIAHGLGRRVHVTVVADDGLEVDSDVEHVDLNTTVITFATPFSGTALIG